MGPLALKLALDGSGWSNEAILLVGWFLFLYIPKQFQDKDFIQEIKLPNSSVEFELSQGHCESIETHVLLGKDPICRLRDQFHFDIFIS